MRPASVHSTDALLLASAAGDQEAFAELFDRLVGPVQVLIAGFVGDPVEIDFVTGSVMVEAWRTAPAFDPATGSASRWVLTLARSRAVERAAAGRARRTQVARAVRRVPTTNPGARSPQATGSLLDALAALPAMHRHALQLAVHGHASYLEVARLLATSPTAVLDAMRTGLQQLGAATISSPIVVPQPTRVRYT